jgi:hypothetical protein
LQATAEMHKIAPNSEQQVINTFNAVLDNLNNTVLDRFTRRDFGAVFEKFIHN